MINTQESGDLRLRRTHKLLWEALMALMTEQEFEAISVKEICERAMVHRTTFYKHYEDKYDLLARGMQQTHEMLLVELELVGKDASSYTQFFAHVAAHERFYRVMLCGNGVGSFQARLQKHFADSITTEMQRLEKGGQKFSVPLSLLAQFYAGALLSSLTWWFSQDLSSSPEQMGNYLKHLLGETIPGRGNAR
ncbi:MAG TPA: TetR/AcrR family transcriptional regulator C-terminal domain-containing protein [Ktedonobacteraceae bacterium]|nr:TetR/AcrR family transcriptional regulator C-terminal domain-containing protein [Ktedonobacteraceae bacterium]